MVFKHNVLISDDDTALLCDFGLSVFASDHSNNYSSQRGGHDRCMAPELMDPGKFGLVSTRPTFASDVYSLGCLCYEVRFSEIFYYRNLPSPRFTHRQCHSNYTTLYLASAKF